MRWLLRVTFVRLALLLGLVLFFVFSPYDLREGARKQRESYTERTSTPMEIAVVWPRENAHLFVEGAELAVRGINGRGGITIEDGNGYRVKTPMVMHEYDEYEYRDIQKVAARIARNLNLSAVIGHSEPDSAIRASVTYQDSGLLYISPSVSDIRLTQHGFWTTVQTVPEDPAISRAMAAFALEHGWHKAAILYVRNSYGATYDRLLREDLGELYARRTQNTNELSTLRLAFQGYYGEEERGFYPLIAALLEQDFDVVFLADSLIGSSRPRTVALIEQLREMGVKQPILGTEELHSNLLWPALGRAANGIFAANLFDLKSSKSNPVARRFRSQFMSLYTNPPTMQGSKAYEAVLLLAQAAERARSKAPLKMATMFRSTHRWDGLDGKGVYDFTLHGAIKGKNVVMEQMKDGTFIPPEIPELCVVYTNRPEKQKKSRRS
jgi:branched-chain amino acid transport system substrate-binding protein